MDISYKFLYMLLDFFMIMYSCKNNKNWFCNNLFGVCPKVYKGLIISST